MAAGTGGRERGSRDRSNETCFHRRGRRSWFRTHFVMAVYKCDSMEHEAWAVSLLHFFTVPLISFSYSSEKSCLWFPLLLFLFFSIFSDSLQQLHAPFQLASAGPNTGRLQPPRKYQIIRAKLLTACFPCPSLSLPLLPLLFPFCPLSLSPPPSLPLDTWQDGFWVIVVIVAGQNTKMNLLFITTKYCGHIMLTHWNAMITAWPLDYLLVAMAYYQEILNFLLLLVLALGIMLSLQKLPKLWQWTDFEKSFKINIYTWWHNNWKTLAFSDVCSSTICS